MTVGVLVTTATAPGGGSLDDNESATYFVAGLTERGDTAAPVLVRSLGEYLAVLGDRVAYGALYDDLQAFFAEGGSRAYVARVVGPAATKGLLNLQDRAGAPVNTLRIEAKDAGAWSTGLTVEVRDGVLANTFDIVVRYRGEAVETHAGLATPAAAVTALNTSAYVRAVDLGSATAAPANNPAVLAATALSAGSDDRASVTASMLVTALARFGPDLGPGVVAIPGQAYTAAAAGIAAHARTHRRLGFTAPAVGTSVSTAITAARSLRATTGAEHVGFFYPWITVPDGAGGTRQISPEGYVAGVRARTIATDGTWRAPAGEIAVSRHAVGVERELTKAEVDSLIDDAVNPIRSMIGTIRLYGWRSLSADQANYRFLNARDVLNEIAFRAERALERFVFRNIDGRGHLFGEIETDLTSIVEPVRAAGGLYEKTGPDGGITDKGYAIDTGPSVNTPASIALGEVRAVLALRVAPVGELIRLTITKVALRDEL